jgi:molybdopterin-guanine dinucleotide biosynthesis protein MobB
MAIRALGHQRNEGPSSTDTTMFNDARKTTSSRHEAAREWFLFHPREIAFCGYSGSGKTTLISRLLEVLTPHYAIGYVKHDAHRFTMDVPGKDTFQARHHGAGAVFINDSSHWAMVSNGAPPLDALRAIYAPFDLVFVEGLKESPLRKVVVLDQGSEGRMAGFLLARSLFENLEVLKLGVHTELQRRGFGTMLMEAAYAEGMRRGCSRCFLEVRKSNQKAIRFYLGHKFRISGVRSDYYSDPVEDAWIMERLI